jgi:hypothetical protein
VVEHLVEKLSSLANEEDKLNAATILTDMLELKEFYSVICRRNVIQQLINIAFSSLEGNYNSSS